MSGRWDGLISPSLAASWPMLYFDYSDLTDKPRQQRFKGVGVRWSEPGLNHLLQLRVAWGNQRFDPLFSQCSLVLPIVSPQPLDAPDRPQIVIDTCAVVWFFQLRHNIHLLYSTYKLI